MASKRAIDWPAGAEALAKAIPKARLDVRAAGAAEFADGTWAVAFSGGSDSLALLLLVWAHWPERRKRVVALHFNHRLRGRTATADAAFCAKVCAALGVRFETGEWQNPPRGASEAQAREARLAFFRRAMKRRRSTCLLLGHQQDDIIETQLMRLGRGSGTGGLAAPRPVQSMPGGQVFVRPLLTLKKGELMAALLRAGAPWREDATNDGDSYLRNRMRKSVVPAWVAAHRDRDAFAGAALARERLEEDDEAMEVWRREIAPVTADGRLNVHGLAGRPRGLVRRALQAWLVAQPLAGDLSRAGFDELLTAVKAGRPTRFSLGRAGFAVIRRGWLGFEGSIPRPSGP